jgi:hypothetical protein
MISQFDKFSLINENQITLPGDWSLIQLEYEFSSKNTKIILILYLQKMMIHSISLLIMQSQNPFQNIYPILKNNWYYRIYSTEWIIKVNIFLHL